MLNFAAVLVIRRSFCRSHKRESGRSPEQCPGMESFKLYGTDRLAYVAADSSKDKKIAGIWKKDWKKPFVIRTFTADESPIIRVSGYFNKDTVVLGADKRLTIYRGRYLLRRPLPCAWP